MKKIVSILLASIIILSFAACSRKADSDNKTTTKATTQVTTQTTTQIVDENLIDVEFTVPASFFNEDDPATDKLTEDQKERGFKKAKLNEDGSVTYTMSKKAFRELKKTMQTDIADSLDNMKEDYSYVKKIEYNKDFSDIKLYVVKKDYENSTNLMAVFQAGLLGQMYQAYTGTPIDKLSVDVSVIDNDTGEQFEEAHYPAEDDN
ncbi:MAG: hypothetical protein IJR70_02730 [Eubacterium sp.]|nr:hypothetical protein [Eubacterium sp.]